MVNHIKPICSMEKKNGDKYVTIQDKDHEKSPLHKP